MIRSRGTGSACVAGNRRTRRARVAAGTWLTAVGSGLVRALGEPAPAAVGLLDRLAGHLVGAGRAAREQRGTDVLGAVLGVVRGHLGGRLSGGRLGGGPLGRRL